MSIRLKLVTILLLISIIPIIVLSVFGMQETKNALQVEIGSKFENVAIEKSRAIKEILNAKIEEARILATHPQIIAATREANGRYAGLTDAETLAAIAPLDKEWIDQKGKTPKAREIAATRLSAFFKRYQERNTEKYGEIFVTDAKGANVAMTKTLSDYYQADEAWWKGGYNAGKGGTFIDDRGFDDSAGAIVAGVVAPVMDDGEFLGVLKINYKVTDVINVISEGQRGEGVEVLLMRSGGNLIVSSVRDKSHPVTVVEQKILSENMPGWRLDEHEGVKTIMGYAPVDSPIYSRILPFGAKKGATGERWRKAIWYTFIEVEQGVAFAAITKLTVFHLWGGVLTTLVVVFVAMILARNISRPIQLLQEGTQIIAGGDLSYRFPLERKDEIGGLARAFNRMTGELQKIMSSQRKLSRAVEQSPAMVIIADVEGNIEYVNPKFTEITQYEFNEAIGKNPRMLKSGKMPPEQYEELWRSIKSGNTWHGEFQNIRKDGTLFWASASISPIISAEGETTHLIALEEDITEQKQASKELHDSEQRFRDFTDAASDWFWEMDSDLRFTYFSERIENATGIPRERLIGKTREEAGQAEIDKEEWANHLVTLEAHEPFKDFEYGLKRADGTISYVRVSGMPVFGNDGDFLGYRGTGMNITENKLNQQALKESEARFRDFAESAGDWFWEMGPDLLFTYHSPRYYEITGFCPTDKIGTGRTHYVAPTSLEGDAEKWTAHFDDLEARRPFKNFEFDFLDEDGKIVSARISGKPVFDEKEKFLGYRGTGTDITERKLAEEAIREKAHHLGERVKELKGLYSLSEITVNMALSVDEICQRVAEVIPPSWQYPDITCGRVTFRGNSFATGNFKESAWGQAADIKINGVSEGKMEVFYTEERPPLDEGPFLQEERDLINDLARRLGQELARRETYEMLRQSEERYAFAVSATNDGLWDRNLHTNEDYLSPRWKQMLGYEENELENVFETFISLLHPDDHDRVVEAVKAHLGERVPYNTEFRLRCKNGEYKWVHSRGQAVWDEKGIPLRMGGAVTDITERKQAEDVIRESEEKYRGIFNESVAAIYVFDDEKNFIDSNQAGLDLLGYSRKELLSMRIPDVDADPSVVLPAHKQLLGGDRLINYEHRLVRKDGRIVTVLNNSKPLTDSQGDVIGMESTLIDITERKQAEEALRKTEELKASIVDGSLEAIVTIDENGKTVEFNRTAEEIFGYSRDEIIGKNIADFIIPPNLRGQHHKAFNKFRETGISKVVGKRLEFKALRADGEEFPMELLITHLKGHRLFTAFIRDLTEPKKIEDALRYSQRMDAIGQLAGGIAHDFNNVLGIIMGNIEILEEEIGDTDAVQERAETALKAARRGADLTARLLQFSREEVFEQSTISVNELISGLKTMLEKSLTKGIELRFNLAKDLWLAEISSGDFEDAIVNLAINSKHAMPKGGTFLVETTNASLDEDYATNNPGVEAGDYVKISVSDTGIGMEKEVADKVFEPFFTTKIKGKGTGLGMSMVFGFVRRSHGHIKVYSEPGYGTTINIYLPKSLGAKKQVTTKVQEGDEPPRGTETVLVVDDEASLVDVAETYLGGLGYRVLTAESGWAALKILDDGEAVDLVFSDVVMPGGMDGFALAQTMSRRHPGVKALLTSGFTAKSQEGVNGDDPEVKALAANILSKPYSKINLARRVRQILDT